MKYLFRVLVVLLFYGALVPLAVACRGVELTWGYCLRQFEEAADWLFSARG